MEKKRKKEAIAAPEIPVEQPVQDYTPDPLKVKKDLYQRDKDLFFADERLYRLDSVNQRDVLGKFFDQVSSPYYNEMGLKDVNTIKELRGKFIEDNIGKLSLSKKKETEEVQAPQLDLPDFVDKSRVYDQFYSRQDIIRPLIVDADINKSDEGFKAVRATEEKIAAVVPNLVETPEFKYIKSNPEEYVLLENFGERKKVDKYLKDQGVSKEERSRILDMLHYTATRNNINKLKDNWDPEELAKAVDEEAAPYVQDAKPGTFIDPATGNRKLQPESEEDADHLALIDKYKQEIRNNQIAGSPDHPLSKKKEALNEKQDQLLELYAEVEEKRKLAQQSLEGALIATSPEVDEWKMAQIEFTKEQADLEKEMRDFNDQIDQDKNITGSLVSNPTDKERLRQSVNDAFIEKRFWDDQYARLEKEYKETSLPQDWNKTVGFRPPPVSPALEHAHRMKYEKTAFFEAASRMFYNNEGPLDIKKDAKYQFEVLGDAILKGISKQETPISGRNTEQSILQKMGEIGMREGVEWTDEEMEQITPKFLEQTMSFAGTLMADLPMLMLIGGATNAIKSVPLISKLRYGTKIIENPVLKEAGKPLTRTLMFADPVPTGWKVVSETAPTAVSKLKGLLIASTIDEAAFTGMMGMTPGFMTGMNTAHLFLPEVKLKGKLGNMLKPFVDVIYKSAIGATAGMEAGIAVSAMANALLTDSTIKQEMDNLYPNLDEVTRRVLVELAVNSVFFGGMGAMTTGSMKAMTAPLGAKWGKGGGESWTAYFNPKLRNRVFKAAKTADEKGYTDTAKELYRWLDMTKEPITGKALKETRLVEMEEYAKSVPVGVLRMGVDANRDAIRVLEGLNNDPAFDGYVTIQTRGTRDVKPMDVVEMDGKYYEVREVAKDKNGKPIEFLLWDIESGKSTKALTEDVKSDIYYKVGSRLELALRLENHYERLQVFNEVLADRGYYGKEAQALQAGPPPPKGLKRATGTFYVKPPEPTKIEKRTARLKEEEVEMQKKGLEPIELPEKLKKEYTYGEPDKIMDLPVTSFAENVAKAEQSRTGQVADFDKKIEAINKQLEDPRFQKRLDSDTRKERDALKDELMRIEYAKKQVDLKFQKELNDFWLDAMPEIENRLKAKGEFNPDEISDILGLVWDKITDPAEDVAKLSVGEIFDRTIDEFTGVKPEESKPVEGKPEEKPTPTAEPQFPEGYKANFADRKNDYKISIYDEKGNAVSYMTAEKEPLEIGGKKYLAIKQVVTDTEHYGKGLGTNIHKYALNNLPEGFEGIVSQKKNRINQKEIPRIHDKLAEVFEREDMPNGDVIFRPKKEVPQIDFDKNVTLETRENKWYVLDNDTGEQIPITLSEYNRQFAIWEKGIGIKPETPEEKEAAEKEIEQGIKNKEARRIYTNNELVSLMEEYNATNNKSAKSKLIPRINSLVREIGYTFKVEGRKIAILNEAGNKARRISVKQQYETIESIADPGLKDFANLMLKNSEYLIGIDAPSMGEVGLDRSVKLLLSGKGTQQSQYLLDALKKMYARGELVFKDKEMGTTFAYSISEYTDLVKDQKFTMFVDRYGGLTVETVEEAAKAGLIDKKDILLYKQAIAEDYEQRIRTEREWAAEEARLAEAELGGRGPEVPADKGEGKPEKRPPPAGKKQVDVAKDLKDMTDLLKLLGGDEAGFGMEQGGEDEMKIRMNLMATNMVRKFTSAGITDFNEMLMQVIPQLNMPVLKKLIPFIKQGYGAVSMNAPADIMEKMAEQFQNVRMFSDSDLDALIGKMSEPESTEDDFSDVVGKTFKNNSLNKSFTILRVEEWSDEVYFRKVKKYEGLFAEDQTFPMLVVAIEGNPVGYAKLETLRKGIASGNITEEKPYSDPVRSKALEELAKEFEALGDNEEAEHIRGRGTVAPTRGLTIEAEIENMRSYLKEKKLELQIQYGEIWFEPKEMIPVTEDALFSTIQKADGNSDFIEPYIRQHVSPEQLAKVMFLENELVRWMSFIGMDHDAIGSYRFLQHQFGGITPRAILLFLGQDARRIANGDKRTRPEKIQERLKQLDKEITEGEKKLADLKKYLFTHRITYFLNNGVAIGNVGDLKRMAKEDFGITDLTTIREQAELALTMLAKRIAQNGSMSISDRFYRIVALYDTFPLQDRLATNVVKELQQFSTPVPMAFLMGVYTNSDVVNSVLDPTGGNGALVIFANRKNVRINELDPNRLKNLISQGYRATDYDATESLKGKFDHPLFYAINTNPPFSVDIKGNFAGAGKYPYTLKGTHYMVAMALENLADEGKAAIVIGEHNKFDKDGYMAGEDLKFFNWLHSNFYVEDVINIPGDLYRRMGTSYPTRLILINGRKPSFEGHAPARTEKDAPVAGWTELYDRITKITTDPHEKAILRPTMDAVGRDGEIVRSRDSRIPKNTEDIGPVTPAPEQIPGTPGKPAGEREKPDVGKVPKPAPGMEPQRPSGTDPILPTDDKPLRSIEDPVKRTPGPRRSIQFPTGTGDIPQQQPGELIDRSGRSLGLIDREIDAVIPYVPLSRLATGNEMVPGAMAQQLEDALMQLRGEVGDIDQYVMQKLKYNSLDDLASAFYGAQIDGVGMSVFNIENGDATIIGDQTGVGKGRIAAGVIAYAIENGYIPVFITKTANLFTDIYRDLFDIGKAGYTPFMLNKEYQGEVTKIYKPNTDEVLFTWDKKLYDEAISRGEVPQGTNFILASYSQFNTEEGNALKRRDFLLSIASRAVFIMDESHDASGTSNTGKFFKDFIERTKGGVYLSATFAKRPDNLPIYAIKTVLREANMSYDQLVEAISNGGPALQEIISSQLAGSIQFTRRQLNMDNIERNWYVLGDDEPGSFFYNPELGEQMKKEYDAITNIMREIIDFQRHHIKPVIEVMDMQVKKEGESAGIKKGTVDLGVDNYPYFSKVFNIVNQLLLAIKVRHVIPLIVDELRAGRKPFITLSNTMEAMITDLDLDYDEVIETDFREVLKRGLSGVMRYTVKTPSGVRESHKLDVTDLSDEGVMEHKRLLDKIREVSTGITISPIDVLIKGITDAGFKVAEITGRHSKFELSDDYMKGKFAINRRPNKNALINSYNNEPGWAIIANISGSTGLSAHSSPKFSDTSQRVGINLQPDLDVNVVVQKDGRINRADQVNKPTYIHIISPLPAEKRIAMMNAKKLKSLYANTTSNQQSSKSITDTTDFLNKYGDRVVADYLKDNPDINNMMGNPVDTSKDNAEISGVAHKVTGKVAVLAIDIQERFYREIIERYEAEIDYLNNSGLNDLEVKNEKLNAVTLSREVVIQGKGGMSVFGDDTVLETIEVDILRKPLTKRELDEQISHVLEGSTPAEYKQQMIADMKAGIDIVFNKRITNLQTSYDSNVAAKKKEAQSKKGTALAVEVWLTEELDAMAKKHGDMLEMLQDASSYSKMKIGRLMEFFYPGRVLEVPFTEGDQLGLIRMNKGVFLGFDINKNKPNPYAPSSIMLKFATADSRRVFRIPASKEAHISQIIANSYIIGRTEQAETRENWDTLKPSRNREKRFIVTGNILQGMAQYKGRLIEYTMQDGTVRNGLLLPENWVQENKGKIIVPATKAYNIIRALAPMDYVESSSGNIQIMKDRPVYDGQEQYQLRVPASRSKGEKYWGDKGLKEFVYDGIFETHGDKMVGIVAESRLKGLLEYIQSHYGETFEIRADSVQKGSSSQGSGINMLREFEHAKRATSTHGERHPEAEVQGAKSKADMGKRIKPVPIEGKEPKPIWQILKDFSTVIDQKIFWDKSVRRGAGSYSAELGKLVVDRLFKNRLDISTHELGHRLDDMFGLVGPEAEPLYAVFQPELKELWQFGSNPPKGSPNPLLYQMREGVAEFFRAFILNPTETRRKYPEFSRWFEARVKRMSPKVWDAIETLSEDARTYLGASGVDRLRKHVKWGVNKEGKVPWGWSSLFKPTSKQGDFIVTKFDLFAQKWLEDGRLAEKAYRWVLGRKGIDIKDPKKMPPSENFITLSHLLLGGMDKFGDMAMFGVTDNKLHRLIDPVTNQAISFPWAYSALPDASLPEMKEFMQMAYAFNAADRILEVIWKLGGRQVRIDLAQDNDMLPPLEILKKYPHIIDKFLGKISRIMDEIQKGKLDPDKVFYPKDRYDHDSDTIYGIAQEGETDKMIADKTKKEWDELKLSDPDKAKQIEEFNRRTLLISVSYIKYAWEGGLISDDLYELITVEDLHYIAFHRYFREHGPDSESWKVRGFDEMYYIGKDSRGYEGRLHIHPIKGSPHPIVDPYLVQIETAYSLVTNTDKNNVLKHFVLAFVGDRDWYQDEPIQISHIGYITKTPSQGKTSMTFYLNGKPMYFEVTDPHVYAALKGLNESPMFRKWATFFPSMLRTMVTHSIPFAIRNPIRDFFSRMVLGHAKSIPNIKKDLKYYDEKAKHMYDLAGGGQFGFYIKNKMDYYRLQREWLFKHSKDPNKYFMDFKTFVDTNWDNIDRFFSKSEKINRISLFKAEYDLAIKEGLSHYDAVLRAAYEARDFLDFHVAGTHMKSLNQFVVFSNAAIRGFVKMAKTMRDRPGEFFAWWAIVALAPSLANSLMIAAMDDDTIDEYKQLPAFQRDMYFNIPLGNGRWLSIPKPFEMGYMASSVQRILDHLILDDDKAFTEDWYRLGYKTFFPFDFAGLTGGFAGLIHAATNRDYFRDKWIIPPSEMDIAVALRNTERATAIGQALQSISGMDARKIDDFITAQFPYYGEYALKGSEIAANIIKGKPVQREMKFDWTDTGVIRSSPVYGAKDVQWVLQTAKKYKLNNHPYIDLLNSAIQVYYSEDVQANRENMLQVGKDIRNMATKIRDIWDQPGIDFVKMHKEAQEFKKMNK